jgi:disease resistance protein RPM1
VVEEPEEEFSSVLCSSLSKTCALRSLHMYSGRTLDSLLHVSSPPPLLQHLTMMGPISQFPDWISSLKHLVEFSVEWAKLAADQLLDSLCKLPSLQSIRLGMQSCRDRELVARTTHSFPTLRILDLYLAGEHPEVVEFEQGSMTKLEMLLLEFSDKERRVVGIDNLKSLKEVKFSGWENNPSLQRALQQLKEENENRPESSQIKVVVQYG